MDRVAVFVDAGYLFAQGSKELCGQRLVRGDVSLDYQAAIAALKDFAEEVSGVPLLRIYWYDGTSGGPSSQHTTLADQANVKVRLGFVNSAGQQKGVDSLIVTDMITLARNRAMAECVLLSGDEDIRVGVQQAQEYGARVHLLGIKPARGSQSQFLIQEADSTHEWTSEDLHAFLTCNPAAVGSEVDPEDDSSARRGQARAFLAPSRSRQPDDVQILHQVARQVARDVPFGDVPSLVQQIRATNRRPQEVDGRLLAMSRTALGQDLSAQKCEVRAAFLEALRGRLEPDGSEAGESD